MKTTKKETKTKAVKKTEDITVKAKKEISTPAEKKREKALKAVEKDMKEDNKRNKTAMELIEEYVKADTAVIEEKKSKEKKVSKKETVSTNIPVASSSASNVEVREKTFLILETDKKSRCFTIYPKNLVKSWVESDRLKSEEGYDIEDAVENIDLEYEYLKDDLICGVVNKLFLKGNKLYGTAKFKINHPSTKKIYEDDTYLDTLTLVPKGQGTIEDNVIQDDYELFGFNLLLESESSFVDC